MVVTVMGVFLFLEVAWLRQTMKLFYRLHVDLIELRGAEFIKLQQPVEAIGVIGCSLGLGSVLGRHLPAKRLGVFREGRNRLALLDAHLVLRQLDLLSSFDLPRHTLVLGLG